MKKSAVDSWPASRIEMWPLDRIKPYPNNPKIHTAEQLALIAASMLDDGVTAPMLVDEIGELIYGHGRRGAAALLVAGGWVRIGGEKREPARPEFGTMPVVIARGWSEEQKRAVRLKDNQLAALSPWNMAALRTEAAFLRAGDFAMPSLGFGETMTTWLTAGDMVTDLAAEWGGMPHFNNPDARAFRSIVVHFHDDDGVKKFSEATGMPISDKTRFLWYPEIIIKPFVKVSAAKPKRAAK